MTDVGHTLKLALFIALGMLSATFIFWWVRSGGSGVASDKRHQPKPILQPQISRDERSGNVPSN